MHKKNRVKVHAIAAGITAIEASGAGLRKIYSKTLGIVTKRVNQMYWDNVLIEIYEEINACPDCRAKGLRDKGAYGLTSFRNSYIRGLTCDPHAKIIIRAKEYN